MEITKDMTIGEIIRENPKAARILMGYGMGCMGCPASAAETLEEASEVHGLEVDELLKVLNKNKGEAK